MNNTLETWGRVKVGDRLVIKDEKTIKQAIQAHVKDAVKGVNVKVDEVTLIVEKSSGCQWKLLKTVADDGHELYVLVKKVGDKFDVRVYEQNEWFRPDTRGNVINRKDFFLFQEPKGDWKPKDLEMAVSFSLNVDGRQTFFDQKNPTLYGEADYKAANENQSNMFAAVTEYVTDKPVANPEVIVFEVGGTKDGVMQDEGGWMLFLEGSNVRSEEIDILPV